MNTTAMLSRHLVYVGERTGGGTVVYTVDEETERRVSLKHIKHHSPSGLDWGYEGSGPADLAHSILCHYLEVDGVSPGLYQRFKAEVVARFPENRWMMTRIYVEKWINERWSRMTEDQVRDDLVA